MYHENLFDEVLIRPALDGADRLYIVSGYATPAMASRHTRELMERERAVSIELIVGMTTKDGISYANHEGFQSLVDDGFSCKYVVRSRPIHSKLYIWIRQNKPYLAFAGSANYTQTGFFSQGEILTHVAPEDALEYFYSVEASALHCEHDQINDLIHIHTRPTLGQGDGGEPRLLPHPEEVRPFESARVSLLTARGDMPARSGLNWGQREEHRREPNQAYIPVHSPLKDSDFFPPRGVYFTAYTDDGQVLTLCRAQDGGKAIHTPLDNSQLGIYFRRRLGLPPGEFVHREDLERYGRTDVTFYKLDDETYFMDFSALRGL